MQHIFISGTGRAGTTLLVQIFTKLGFDTGFSKDEVLDKVDGISRAGLEIDPYKHKAGLPHVIKAPALADRLDELLALPDFEIEAAIVPVRDLYAAAESRRRVFNLAKRAGLDARKHPGSLWKTRKPKEQEGQLAEQFFHLVHSVVRADRPIYLLDFPRFARDPDYLYDKLKPIFDAQGVSVAQVRDVMGDVVRQDFIHSFEKKSEQSWFF